MENQVGAGTAVANENGTASETTQAEKKEKTVLDYVNEAISNGYENLKRIQKKEVECHNTIDQLETLKDGLVNGLISESLLPGIEIFVKGAMA
jgi:hypothetical protein